MRYKALPPITESAGELRRRRRAEKDLQNRQRRQALYLLAPGQAASRLEIAALLAAHRHTVRAGLAAYEEGGLSVPLTIRQAPGALSALCRW